jgi:hypothetical protein
MPKRNLRIVTRGATIPVPGICEYCNAQSKSNEPPKDDTKAELRAQFDGSTRASANNWRPAKTPCGSWESLWKKIRLTLHFVPCGGGQCPNFRYCLASRRAGVASRGLCAVRQLVSKPRPRLRPGPFDPLAITLVTGRTVVLALHKNVGAASSVLYCAVWPNLKRSAATAVSLFRGATASLSLWCNFIKTRFRR